jgi:hypothetical protein
MNRESTGTTLAGYPFATWINQMGYRTGYVGVPKDHPAHGLDYYPEGDGEVEAAVRKIDVHGGLTYADGKNNYPLEQNPEDLWWFGFDCAHLGDAPIPGYTPYPEYMDGITRSLQYVQQECENLAQQLKDMEA